MEPHPHPGIDGDDEVARQRRKRQAPVVSRCPGVDGAEAAGHPSAEVVALSEAAARHRFRTLAQLEALLLKE